MKFEWNPDLYDTDHNFVSKFGEDLVCLLDPQQNETILDVGCGTGDLTKTISNCCQKIVGIDNSSEMIQAANEKYRNIDFYKMDAKTFNLNHRFDAVFSNAVLHWLPEAECVVQNINKHLKVNGRFIAEFGGKGCLKRIINGLTNILDDKGVDYPDLRRSLFYPSIGEYATLLERNGFEMSHAMMFDRPTKLNGGRDGLKKFIDMFFDWVFIHSSSDEKKSCIQQLEKRLENDLLFQSNWIADYKRIRIMAVKKTNL